MGFRGKKTEWCVWYSLVTNGKHQKRTNYSFFSLFNFMLKMSC